MSEPERRPVTRRRSLMAKLVVSFLVLSVAMVAIVGAVAYLRARSSLQTSVFDRLEAASELKTDSLDRWIDEQRRNVVFVAGLLGGYETGDSVTTLNRDVQALLEGRLDGEAADVARANIEALLGYMVSKTADAQEFLALDLEGTIVVSTVAEHVGLSQADAEFFRNGSSNTYVQPVSTTELSTTPVISIATPLFARGGQRIAVLAANLNLDRLDRIVLEQTGLGQSGETYLVGEDGRFVHGRLAGEFPDPVTSYGIEQGLRQVDGEALYENYEGEPVIGVYRWFDETGSTLLAEMSQDEAFAPARQLALTIFLIGLAVVALLGFGIYVLSRRIARPVLAITETATAVSTGDLTREAPVTTNDEVGTLAIAFNEMTSQLRENVETLEQRVDERTAELSTALEGQREAEAEIRRQKLYFEELVEISPAAVVTMDTDERVTGWNPAATRLFGYSPEEALGRATDELVLGSASQLEEGRAVAREAADHGQASRITRRTRKDGSLVDVEILVVPLVIDEERVGSYAIYHDIGELQEARKQADAANQAKGAFLAAMSHEIRTPMNAIIGMGGLLAETDLDPDQREYASTIASSGEALLAIINDILDFSKIEAGKMELERAPFDLRGAVESVIDLVGPAAGKKGLEVAYEIEPGTPEVAIGDAARLRQVLLNLLNNALKFTEAGEIVVGVAATGGPGPENHSFHLTVRDTGIGVPPDRVGRLFQSFSQADVSTSRRFGGTGLGLAISNRLAELMDGTMWVESDGVPGHGSTFHMTFVADASDTPPTALQPDRSLTGLRGLVVDDNATNRRLMSALLASWGATTATSEDARSALSTLDDSVDLAFAVVDMLMPAIDGLDLALELHRRLPKLPIVLASSIPRRDVAGDPRWDHAGIAAVLTKPIKASSLLTAISAAVGSTDRARSEEGATTVLDPDLASKQPLRILLAEDNVVNQKLAIRLLQKMGYRADVVGNGVEVLEAVARQPYDLLLSDVQMPEMDGLEATRLIIERWPEGDRPWIVGVTAEAMQGDRERCLEAGMNDYISKPIRTEELVAAIMRTPRRRSAESDGSRVEGDGRGPIDADVFRRFTEGVGGDDDPAFVTELIQQFLDDDAPTLVAAIAEGLDAGDADGVRRAAHTLKSNAATFGATELSARSRTLEEAAMAGDLSDGRSTGRAIAAAFDEVQRVLPTLWSSS